MTFRPMELQLDEIREEICELEPGQERLSYLIELGDALPPFPSEACIEENRVLGCQSMVWLISEEHEGRIRFLATSDAPMVRGLIAILLAAYSDRTPEEILNFRFKEFFEEIQMPTFLSPMRSNGLYSMIQRVRQIAEICQSSSSHVQVVNPQSPSRLSKNPSRNIEGTRQDFPILDRRLPSGKPLVYLDNAASSQRPNQVIEAMDHVYRHSYSNAHRSGHQLAAEATVAMEASREALRAYLSAQTADEIIFTSGATASINLVARSWGDEHVGSGDEIILSEMEHHSNIVPWQQLALRRGATIRWIPVRDDYHLDLEAYRSLLNDRTKIVSITAVSNVLGTINPVKEMVQAAHAHGAIALIDAAQAVPHGPMDVRRWDADFVAFSGHKMLGPSGIGVLYGKRAILDAMPPFLGGGGMIDRVTVEGFTVAGIPHRFEAGTPPIAEAIAMKEAVDYLTSFEDRAIWKHEQSLVARAEAKISGIPGIRIFGPKVEERAGLLTFTIDGMHSDEVGRYLDAQGIAIRVGHHCAMPLHQRLGIPVTCRASFYLYNTKDEVEQFAGALHEIIQHSARR